MMKDSIYRLCSTLVFSTTVFAYVDETKANCNFAILLKYYNCYIGLIKTWQKLCICNIKSHYFQSIIFYSEIVPQLQMHVAHVTVICHSYTHTGLRMQIKLLCKTFIFSGALELSSN